MNIEPEFPAFLWERALKSIVTAEKILEDDPDTAANRAYYSAFHAVSALFAVEGQFFRKHAGVQSELHRQLIRTKRMAKELGDDYDKLLALRAVADYGAAHHVTTENARLSIERARRILTQSGISVIASDSEAISVHLLWFSAKFRNTHTFKNTGIASLSLAMTTRTAGISGKYIALQVVKFSTVYYTARDGVGALQQMSIISALIDNTFDFSLHKAPRRSMEPARRRVS